MVGCQHEDVPAEHEADHPHLSVDEAAVFVNVVGQAQSHAGVEDDRLRVGGHSSVVGKFAGRSRKLELQSGPVDGCRAAVGDREESEIFSIPLQGSCGADCFLEVCTPHASSKEALKLSSAGLALSCPVEEVQHRGIRGACRLVLPESDASDRTLKDLLLQILVQSWLSHNGLQLLEVTHEHYVGRRMQLCQRRLQLSPHWAIDLADLVQDDEVVVAQASRRDVCCVGLPDDLERRVDGFHGQVRVCR